MASSIYVDLVRPTDRFVGTKRRAGSSIEGSSRRTFHTAFANKVVPFKTAAGSSVPFSIGAAELTDWHALMFVVWTYDIPDIAFLFGSTSYSVPERTNRASATEAWSDLIVSLVAGTGDSIEPTVVRAGWDWWLNWLTDAVVHEISALAQTVESVPVCIDGTVGNYFAGTHDVLIPFEADASFLDVAVDHIVSADGDGNVDAEAIIVSVVPVEADALDSIEDFVVSTGLALAVDHVEARVANADSVEVVTVGAAGYRQAVVVD